MTHRVLDRTFAAVLFDMDGTLISSIGSVERSWTRLAEEFDIRRGHISELHGVPARAVLDVVLADRAPEVRAAALRRIVEIEVGDVADIEVLPGAAEALAATAPAGRAAIVTSCTRDLARARLAASGLLAPAVVLTADDVSSGKPHPEPYLSGAAALGVAAGECLVVEDAAAGLASGRAAGAATLGVATTPAATPLDADLVVADLSHVRLTVTADGVRVSLA